MNRREFLASTAAAAGSLYWGGCHRPERKPNIIFLLTDDQRWDTLGCMGNPVVQTPNIDRMAGEGTIFENAYVTTSICMCSRASILLGQYVRRHNINDFDTDMKPDQLKETYPMILKRAGYRIGFIGKYGVGSHFPAEQFDFWRGIPGQPHYEMTDEAGQPIHLTRLMGNEALEFLDECTTENPFCLSVSFKAPHAQDSDERQFIADPEYDDLYEDMVLPVPETATNEALERLPDFMKDEGSTSRIRWHRRFADPEMVQRMVKRYYRLITGVDDVVGRIRETLEKKRLAENTVILYMGDNGFFLGEHGLAGKWYGREESIRVPLIVYDPGIRKGLQGQRREEMALNIDVAPTILDLAGIEKPSAMQGQSLTPLMRGKHPSWRQSFFYEHLFRIPEAWQERGVGRIPPSEGVVTAEFKYLKYIDETPVYEELFDLVNDPGERNNLAQNALYTEKLQQLRKECESQARALR